jgi:protein O-mannosyl-transferase
MTILRKIKDFLLTSRGAVVLLILLSVLIYLPSLPNEMFWDDDDFILKNRYVKDWSYFPKFFSENLVAGSFLNSNYWRPMLLIIFSAEWHLWGTWTPGWHMVNTAFHTMDAILLFYIIFLLFRNHVLALCTALIFLTHPIQVESVVYVNSLGDSLSVFFMFASLLMYVRYRLSNTNAFFCRTYYFAVLLYPLALLSKESGILLPGFIAISDFILLNPKKTFLARAGIILRAMWPFIVIALIYVGLRATVLNFMNTFNFYNEETEFTKNYGLRFLNFFQVLQIYFGLMVFPYDLRVERILDIPKTFFTPAVAFGGAFFTGLVAAAVFNWKKRPLVTYGILWFFVGLILTSNLFVAINALVYEHFLYVPLIGLALVVVWLAQNYAQRRGLQNALAIAFAIVIALYCIFSIKRVYQWRTAIGFYEDLVKHSPDSYRVINNLGMEYADKNIHDKAEGIYLRAIKLDPKNPVGYHNLAGTYRDTGRKDLAIETFKKAVVLDPQFIFSYKSLAQLYWERRDYPSTRRMLEEYFNRSDEKLSTIELLLQVANMEGNLTAMRRYLELAQLLLPNDRQIVQSLQLVDQKIREQQAGQPGQINGR